MDMYNKNCKRCDSELLPPKAVMCNAIASVNMATTFTHKKD